MKLVNQMAMKRQALSMQISFSLFFTNHVPQNNNALDTVQILELMAKNWRKAVVNVSS